MRPELLDQAAAHIEPLLSTDARRVLVGLAGAPGAGKTTLSEALARRFRGDRPEPAAIAIPMDGFHLSQTELHRLGLSHRKGAPETFDPGGFVHLLRRLRAADELVYAPMYSRVVHESIGSAIPVLPGTRLLIIEGNYLLLDGAWRPVRDLLDLTIYVEAPEGQRVAGLIRRQRSFGLADAAARDWVERSDEANARVIEGTRANADVILSRAG